jgi:hypothetical protein
MLTMLLDRVEGIAGGRYDMASLDEGPVARVAECGPLPFLTR